MCAFHCYIRFTIQFNSDVQNSFHVRVSAVLLSLFLYISFGNPINVTLTKNNFKVKWNVTSSYVIMYSVFIRSQKLNTSNVPTNRAVCRPAS
jgi:hypothetical protein